MTRVTQNRSIVTFPIPGLLRAKGWTATLTACQLYTMERKRIRRVSASFGQNFSLCFSKSMVCVKEASTVGLVTCMDPMQTLLSKSFFLLTKSGHKLVCVFQGKPMELPCNYYSLERFKNIYSHFLCNLWNVGWINIKWIMLLGPSLFTGYQTYFCWGLALSVEISCWYSDCWNS